MHSSRPITVGRVVKLVISTCVFTWTSALDVLARAGSKETKGRCVILYYHSVAPAERKLFARQLDVLLRHATPIAVDCSTVLPNGQCVGVTFDDAFENFVTTALPELQERHIPVTVFVITQALGRAFGPVGDSEPVMSAQQLMALPEELVTIGSHTETHPMLTQISDEDSLREIVESRNHLEDLLGREITLFSFPFGDFDESLCQVCREAGYRRVFTTLPLIAFAKPDEFIAGRVRVDPTDWLLEFRLKLAGAYRWLPMAFRLKRWVSRTISGHRRQEAKPESMVRDLTTR
jgi:peptidoglycan/xylan/chitin deacetylase (PgdA/CDA1 family)